MIDRLTTWSIDHPRPWRAISTTVYLVVVVTSAYTAMKPDQPIILRSLFFGLANAYLAVTVVMWRRWIRRDALDVLRKDVVFITDSRLDGEIAWMWADQSLNLHEIREVADFVNTHDLSVVPRADMPPKVNELCSILLSSA